MKYIIITGTSRGLGEAIAESLLEQEHHLFCISRSKSNSLLELAQEKEVNLDYIEYDLNHSAGITSLMEDIFKKIDIANATGLYLINNAGVLKPIKVIEEVKTEELVQNINVNLVAPMLLVANFIGLARDFELEKRIINISSGAGKKPYYGWSSYCSSKAAIDLFTETVALEQEEQKEGQTPVEILSFVPGVVDTKMQEKIRATDKKDFINKEKFVKLKEEGKLLTPQRVADYINNLLFSSDFKQGGVIDIRDFIID